MTDPNLKAASPSRMSAMSRRYQLFDQLLGLFAPGRLVDLGAGHGMFSVRAAEAGWIVTAVDARPDRFPEHPSVRWEVKDVRQVDLSGYDVIACLGLFYHLTPQDQVSLLRRASGTPMIIDTHLDNGRSTHRLSERELVDDYEGSWYREGGALTSSWGNPHSFWPTPDSFHRILHDCGYPVVLTAEPWVRPDRTFFLALPRGYATRSGRPAQLRPLAADDQVGSSVAPTALESGASRGRPDSGTRRDNHSPTSPAGRLGSRFVAADRAHAPGPVFVGGTGRSGTTIAGQLIGHSATYELIPVEARFHADSGGLPDLVSRRVTVEQFVESMKSRWYWREPSARGTPRGLHTFVEKDAFEDALARLQAGFARDSRAAANRLIHDLLDPVAERAGKPSWVEMTPPVVRGMPVLAELLPDARFVHMIRDGRDVATSVVRRPWGPNDFTSAMDWWVNTMIAIGRAEANTPSQRVLRLRLETLVGPQRHVAYQRLCDFLGVGDSGMRAFFDESVTRAGARIGRWRTNRDADEIAEVDKLYRAAVSRLEDAGVSMPAL